MNRIVWSSEAVWSLFVSLIFYDFVEQLQEIYGTPISRRDWVHHGKVAA